MNYNLQYVESRAKGDIKSLTVHYFNRKEPVEYNWEQRKQVDWNNVKRCRLNWAKPKVYMIDGDACERPGYRICSRGVM